MNIREISTARLRDYENNPRNNDLAVEKVKYSIERFGFLFPVVVDMNYVIVCGHTRVRACREMGLQTVPCIIADELTDEQINLFRLVDNKSNEYSDWDFEKLKNELSLVDLTLDKNQLLIDRFELSAEVFDIEPEQAEIKIPAFNFMGVNDRPKERKHAVRTIDGNSVISSADDMVGENDDAIEPSETFYSESESTPASAFSAEATPEGTNIEMPDIVDSDPKKKETKAARAFCQFRFGDVSFFISQVELDQLNNKYAEYIDSDALLEGSFANYLLKGAEIND